MRSPSRALKASNNGNAIGKVIENHNQQWLMNMGPYFKGIPHDDDQPIATINVVEDEIVGDKMRYKITFDTPEPTPGPRPTGPV